MSHLVEKEEKESKNNIWTRVFSRDDIRDKRLALFPLGPDLIYDKSMRNAMSQLDVLSGEVLFSPLLIKKEDMVFDLDLNKLSQEKLMEYGLTATQAKTRFRLLEASVVNGD